MNPTRTESTKTLAVLQSEEVATSKGRYLKVTAYPWGVEFELPEREEQE